MCFFGVNKMEKPPPFREMIPVHFGVEIFPLYCMLVSQQKNTMKIKLRGRTTKALCAGGIEEGVRRRSGVH
jgi:hypothetical protein